MKRKERDFYLIIQIFHLLFLLGRPPSHGKDD